MSRHHAAVCPGCDKLVDLASPTAWEVACPNCGTSLSGCQVVSLEGGSRRLPSPACATFTDTDKDFLRELNISL